MAESLIDYGGMVRRALQGVVREALALASRDGLPGDHHFFVTFSTQAPGVEIPRVLRDLHPDRLTVVLQHQYWDLEVDDERFSVTLSFGGQRLRIGVPFPAVEAFADPAVDLELRFAAPTIAPTEQSDPAAASTNGVDVEATIQTPSTPGDSSGGDVLPFSRRRPR